MADVFVSRLVSRGGVPAGVMRGDSSDLGREDRCFACAGSIKGRSCECLESPGRADAMFRVLKACAVINGDLLSTSDIRDGGRVD